MHKTGGGYEVFRKYVNDDLDTERTTLHLMDDTKTVAIIDTLTVEGGDAISEPEPEVRYQYDNHLGSACLELNYQGKIISYEEYHPFGTTSYRSGRSEVDVALKRYKYVGKERNEETGLYYYGARYGVYPDEARIGTAWLCRFVSVDPLQHDYPQLTPFNYAGNKPVTHYDIDGMQGTGDDKATQVSSRSNAQNSERQANGNNHHNSHHNLHKVKTPQTSATAVPTELSGVTINEQKSNASPDWKSFIGSMGAEGYKSYVNELYQTKIAPYQTSNGFNTGLYGRDANEFVNVPQEIKNKLWQEANKEAMPTLKTAWAEKKSGVDPNSLNYMFNPFARAAYMYTKALTVSSKDEGSRILSETALEVAITWTIRLTSVKIRKTERYYSTTPFQIKNGKNFRIDWDTKNGWHYHRRGFSKDGFTKTGQGIGRHRPWQKKSPDKSFFDRF